MARPASQGFKAFSRRGIGQRFIATVPMAQKIAEPTSSSVAALHAAADLVVLDRDVFAEAPGRIGDTRVLLTLVEGAAVHEDPALAEQSTEATAAALGINV